MKSRYLVSYIVDSEYGHIPVSASFRFRWRARLEVWLKLHQKDISNVSFEGKYYDYDPYRNY